MSSPSALARLPRFAQWSLLLIGSYLAAALLERPGLPAAILLGPMLAAILVETNGGTIRVPRLPHYGAQAVIGCLVAGAITPAIIASFLAKWPLFLGIVFAIVIVGALLGFALSRLRVLPATTAIWGLCPGAASAMMLMADAFGADARLVAFMQYLRVVFVTVAASVIARLWQNLPAAAHPIVWFPSLAPLPFIETLGLALLGGGLGYLARLPAGIMLVPMCVGAALHGAGLLTIVLPPWLLAASYALLGWSIGLGFTRQILAHAARALPQTIVSILIMMGFCGSLAFILVKALGIDPLTAYLATSPGGMDSIAIIGASSKVDLSFIMALQVARFVVVLAIGPALSRMVASWVGETPPPRVAIEAAETLAQIREDEGDLD
jgi:hypothetical protein